MNHPRRQRRDHVSHERWLVSYADFVTLLFAFFVVMYASAQIDHKKAVQLSSAIESAFQNMGIFPTDDHRAAKNHPPASDRPAQIVAPPSSMARIAVATRGPQEINHQPEDFAAIRAQLEKALANEIKRHEVALRLEPDGLVVSLREIGFFDSGSATIKPEAQGAFARVAQILRSHSFAVRIEGHTDNVPIHTTQFASNWELSTARAIELVKVLIEKHGLEAEHLSAAGYAEFHPVADNDSNKGRQLNRRVDVVILSAPQTVPLSSPPPLSLAPVSMKPSHPASQPHDADIAAFLSKTSG